MAKNGDVNKWSSDSDVDAQKAIEIPIIVTDRLVKDTSNKHKDALGKKVAKDFRKLEERYKVLSMTVTMQYKKHLFSWLNIRIGVRNTLTRKNLSMAVS